MERNTRWTFDMTDFQEVQFEMNVLCDSTVFRYKRPSIASSETERVILAGNDSSIYVLNEDAAVRAPKMYDLTTIAVAPDSEIVFGIQDMTVSEGDSVAHSITSESGLKIDNYGNATHYNLRVYLVGSESDTLFHHQQIEIASDCSHKLIPDWRVYEDSLLLMVDQGMTGVFTDSIMLSNEPMPFICGNTDAREGVDIDDVVYLIAYVFQGASEPFPVEAGDVNCSGGIDIDDIVYLINFIFQSGYLPCDPNGDGERDC